VRFYDDVIKGKVVLIQFMYAECEKSCPMTTPNLVKVQKELKRRGATQVSMISITVDPEHDTPQVLKAYAKQYRVSPGWQFLTGKKADVDLIRRQLGVYDPDQQKIAHMNVLTIGKEPAGRWLAMEALAKPGDIVDTVLRLDPVAGKLH
jgi:protein SCO1/2